MTSSEMISLLPSFEVLTAGPDLAEQQEEIVRRTGFHPTQPGPAAVEVFAGTRIELTYEEALRKARDFRPDLVVCEALDYVGPMVAFALGVPWAVLGVTGSLPAELAEAIRRRWEEELDRYSLQKTERLVYLDPFPAFLREEEEELEPDRVAVRPEPFDRDDDPFKIPEEFDNERRRHALLTLGTSVQSPEGEDQMTQSLVKAGFHVIVAGSHDTARVTRGVHRAGFVPLARVLPWADVIVSPGGVGTMLAALATETPMVVRPFHADQPWNAERLSRANLAMVIDKFDDAGPAASRILSDPLYRKAAAQAARDISRMKPLPEAFHDLERKAFGPGGRSS